jgi:hypothetical protein
MRRDEESNDPTDLLLAVHDPFFSTLSLFFGCEPCCESSGLTALVQRSWNVYPGIILPMTLTLAARNPELWRAAVDMFGPFDKSAVEPGYTAKLTALANCSCVISLNTRMHNCIISTWK